MPYTSGATHDELLQMVEDLESRAEASAREHWQSERRYDQALADKAQLEELLAQNNIALPKHVPAHQVSYTATGGTINVINNYNINPNTWDASNDCQNLVNSNDHVAPSGSANNKVTTPPMPSWQDPCTRKRCCRRLCKMVHADQVRYYGTKAIKDLPWRAATKET